ncbi:MAG: autotransporter domain-containing protein, partial [Proteobacteria bacterium]|nr:autotransporter domain-containing protein [Pseudomonadota bacterium]
PATSTTFNGTATINGTLTSPTITVGATGNLGGTGQITGNLTNNGNVSPGTSIGTLNIAGNYVQGAGGTLQVEINANGTNDQLHATGTANLAGTLQIVTQGTYTGANQHVVLIADAGINGTFDTVTGLAAANTLRRRFAVSYTATQVLVTATVLTYESLVRGYGGHPVGVAKCLDTIANNATGDMATIINQLDHLPDVAALAAAFQQLHCGHYNAFSAVNFNTQHLFIALGQARLYQLRTGVAVTGTAAGFSNPTTGPLLAFSGNLGQLGRLLSSDASPGALEGGAVFAGPPGEVLRTAYAGRRLGIWVRPFGIIEDQETVDGHAGYNFTTTGFSAGFDYRFTAHFIAGVSLGYATSRVKYDDVGGSSGDVRSYTAGVYGSWFGPRWFVEFSVAYGRNSFDMNRKIKFGATDRTATSNYRGFALTAQLGGGYDFPVGRSWTLGPVFSLEAVHQEQDGFTESGAGALNLTLGRQSATSVRGAVGVRVRRVFKGRGGRRVTISLSALWVHEFANNAQSVNASMQGNPATPFTVRTPEPERDAVRLGIGVTAKVSRRVSLFAAYQPEFRPDNQSHYVSAGVRFEF